MEEFHREKLEEEATHATDEARMVLPGVQAIMGFQLIAVFNNRFAELARPEQLLHLGAFFLMTVAMGLIMAPAAYHRQVERGCVTRRFVDLASRLLTASMPALMLGLAMDSYILTRMVGATIIAAASSALLVTVLLAGLWFVTPHVLHRRSSE